MKVYVVTSGDYSDYGIEAVFTDAQKAIDYAKYCCSWDAGRVEEYETKDDEIVNKCKKLTCTCNVYDKDYTGSKAVIKRIKNPFDTFEYELECCTSEDMFYDSLSHGELMLQFKLDDLVTEETLDINKYKKIMQDTLAKIEYELSQGATWDDIEKLF